MSMYIFHNSYYPNVFDRMASDGFKNRFKTRGKNLLFAVDNNIPLKKYKYDNSICHSFYTAIKNELEIEF